MRGFILKTAAVTFVLMFAVRARAAIIIWNQTAIISADSDVSTAGSLIAAFNVGAPGTPATTVNSVLFQPFAVSYSSDGATVGNFTLSTGGTFGSTITEAGSPKSPFSRLSTAYQALLGAAAEEINLSTYSLTMSSLTVGTQYQFEWWSDLSNIPSTTFTYTTFASLGVYQNTAGAAGGVGEFDIGTFTADAMTETIEFDPVTGGGLGRTLGQFNAFQLREVPEPASVVLLATGSLVLLARRRIFRV